MATSSYTNVLTDTEINDLLHLQEVLDAKQKIDGLEKGHVYFEIQITDDISSALQKCFNIDFSGVQKIPMRWIKGDTLPHIDTSRHTQSFDNTYLLYLTDSQGELVVEETHYPIMKNTGFVFSEGLYHETVNTGNEPRLLLGPMNELSQPVGSASIGGSGGTTLYIREVSGIIEWSNDEQQTWSVLYFPSYVYNTDTNGGFLEIKFLTDITINNNIDYLICATEYIQFGSKTLNNDGSRPTITINTNNYDGFIENGNGITSGNSNIAIYNLYINGGANQTQINGGWIGKMYFGYNVTNNYIVNCASSGGIEGGGIVGAYAGSGGILTLRGCSSSGIIGNNAGGIAGAFAGDNGGSLVCESCWSTGEIQGGGAGGIAGHWCHNVVITKCYSTGAVTGPYDGGGIVGDSAGQGVNGCVISNCYSTGSIQVSNGGIVGAVNTPGGGNCLITITNCYSTGNLISTTQEAGAILSRVNPNAAGTWTVTVSSCYACGNNGLLTGYIVGDQSSVNGSDIQGNGTTTWSNNYSEKANGSTGWNDTNANSVLTGTPNPTVGTTWVSTVTGQPYELLNMGYSPYSLTNISGSNLVRIASSSINAGLSTTAGTTSTYSIVQKSGGDSSSYGTITINGSTGVISTTSGTAPGVYTLLVRNTGSYDFTTFTLTVTAAICFLKGTTILCKDNKYRRIEHLKSGDMIKTYLHGDVAIDIICHTDIHHSREKDKQEQLFVYKKDSLSFLTQDLVLTGGHSVLVDQLTEKQEQSTVEMIRRICITDNKYRLLSCLDDRAIPYEKEESDETIYHICLHHPNPNMNYGIWANGMLTETCQKTTITKYMI